MSEYYTVPFVLQVEDETEVTVDGLKEVNAVYSVSEDDEKIAKYYQGDLPTNRTYSINGDKILLPADEDSRISSYLIMGERAVETEEETKAPRVDHKELECLVKVLVDFGEDPDEILNGNVYEVVEKLNKLPKSFFAKLAKTHVEEVAESKGLKVMNLDEIEDIEVTVSPEGNLAMVIKTPVMTVSADTDDKDIEVLKKALEEVSETVIKDEDDIIALKNAFKEYIPELDSDDLEIDEIDVDVSSRSRAELVQALLSKNLASKGYDFAVRTERNVHSADIKNAYEYEEEEQLLRDVTSLKNQMRKTLEDMGIDVDELDRAIEENDWEKIIRIKEERDRLRRVPDQERVNGLAEVVERKMRERNLTFDDYDNPKPVNNQVNHPSHYQKNGMECIDFIKSILSPAEYRGFLKGNMMKYEWRAGAKEGNSKNQDLDKSKWYKEELDRLNKNNR